MGFSFSVDKPKNFGKVMLKLKQESLNKNIKFAGDENSGTATGYGFSGEYKVHENSIEFICHKKPFLISETKIKQTVNDFLVKMDAEV